MTVAGGLVSWRDPAGGTEHGTAAHPEGSQAVPRTVTVLVAGVPTLVACPSWCRVDHEGQRVAELGDIGHFSPLDSVAPGVGVELWWSPGHGPRLLVTDPTGDAAELDLPAAERLLAALADKVGVLRAATAGVIF